MRTKLIATVHILLDTTDDDEAADILSGLLTECGTYGKDSGILDWAYTKNAAGDYQYSRPIEIPDESEEVDLADFIADCMTNNGADA